MIDLKRAAYILFDGDCGICNYSAGIGERLDRRKRFIFEPYQIFPEEELKRYGLDYGKCSRSLQAINPEGKVYSGAFAVNYFLWRRFPWNLMVFIIYAIPPILLLELIIYRLVANNRGRISGWLGMQACAYEK